MTSKRRPSADCPVSPARSCSRSGTRGSTNTTSCVRWIGATAAAVTALGWPASVSARNSAPLAGVGVAKSASVASGLRSADMQQPRLELLEHGSQRERCGARAVFFAGVARAAGATGFFAVLLRPGAADRRARARLRRRGRGGPRRIASRCACCSIPSSSLPVAGPRLADGRSGTRGSKMRAQRRVHAFRPNALFRKDNRLRAVDKCHSSRRAARSPRRARAARAAHRASRRDVRHAVAARHADDIRPPASGPDETRHRAARRVDTERRIFVTRRAGDVRYVTRGAPRTGRVRRARPLRGFVNSAV